MPSDNREQPPASASDPSPAGWLGRLQDASFSRAAPTLFSICAEAFWLRTVTDAARIANVRAHPWLAVSILEGEHDTHAAVFIEGPAEVLATVPEDVRSATALRNHGGSLAWATTWLRMTPQRLFSFAERAWQDVTHSS